MKKLRIVAFFAFFLNTFLYATYYSVARGALARIDPVMFTFFVMIALVPVALIILACSWQRITKASIKSGALLGSCLGLGLFTLAVALKYNSATSTAFFPSLNGLLAAIFSWLILRQAIGKMTWFAGGISVVGAVLLISNSPMGGVRGALIAFIGGLFCTFYVFLADHEQRDQGTRWPLLGFELLTMALWAGMIALLFGDWQAVHPALMQDSFSVLYIAFGTTFLPILITVLLQNYIKPLTVSFIYILEPVLGAIVAYIYLHEMLPLYGYVGGGLVVLGATLNTWSSAQQAAGRLPWRQRLAHIGAYIHTSLPGTFWYPLLCCLLGAFLVYRLGGFPPASWQMLYSLGPQIPTYFQQAQTSMLLLAAQALSWLIAWVALAGMSILASYRAIHKLAFASKAALSEHSRRKTSDLGASSTVYAYSPQWQRQRQQPSLVSPVPTYRRQPAHNGYMKVLEQETLR
ncbi:MAG TPA: DMT family transporter [Ktedonobacteraceae bacterium]|jgi:drug/metabolite transporter (DMT)-like permease